MDIVESLKSHNLAVVKRDFDFYHIGIIYYVVLNVTHIDVKHAVAHAGIYALHIFQALLIHILLGKKSALFDAEFWLLGVKRRIPHHNGSALLGDLHAGDISVVQLDLIKIAVEAVGVFADKIDARHLVIAKYLLYALFLTGRRYVVAVKSFDLSVRKRIAERSVVYQGRIFYAAVNKTFCNGYKFSAEFVKTVDYLAAGYQILFDSAKTLAKFERRLIKSVQSLSVLVGHLAAGAYLLRKILRIIAYLIAILNCL